jgi:hypothetical protein
MLNVILGLLQGKLATALREELDSKGSHGSWSSISSRGPSHSESLKVWTHTFGSLTRNTRTCLCLPSQAACMCRPGQLPRLQI